MWVFQIFKLIWDNLFNQPIGIFGFTFGSLLLGTFIIGFLASTLHAFMHRRDK